MSTLPAYCTEEAHGLATMRGRAAEWSAALDLLTAAHEGRSGVLLVEGEPGIGKSLLLREATRTARACGFSSVTAGSPELGRMPLMESLLSALGEDVIADGEGPSAEPDRRMWRVERIRAGLDKRAGADPVLVSLDDLQLVAPTALATLRAWTSQLAGRPVAWLLACSTVKAGKAAGRLFDLLEYDGARRITLPPLDDDALTGIVIDMLGAAPDPRLAALAGQSGGNPYLLTGLIAGLRGENGIQICDGGARLVAAGLPRRFQAAARHLLDQLGPRTRHLLTVTAVLARSFSPDAAAAVLGTTPAAIVLQLDEALSAGVLTVAGEELAAWDADDLAEGLRLAREAVRRAASTDAWCLHPRMILAMLLTDVRRLDEARSVMASAGDDTKVRGRLVWAAAPAVLRARLHLAAGRFDDAIAEAEAGLAATSGLGPHVLMSSALAVLAVAALRSGDPNAAQRCVDRARPGLSQYGSPHAEARFALVRSQIAKGGRAMVPVPWRRRSRSCASRCRSTPGRWSATPPRRPGWYVPHSPWTIAREPRPWSAPRNGSPATTRAFPPSRRPPNTLAACSTGTRARWTARPWTTPTGGHARPRRRTSAHWLRAGAPGHGSRPSPAWTRRWPATTASARPGTPPGCAAGFVGWACGAATGHRATVPSRAGAASPTPSAGSPSWSPRD
ncbi:AAA family ATPase [Actinoallomurus purpureus]|uniref:AAA family ATPase n=1 Tax=Actinoallomurus purpureus TaxID=478114 RepID=UPI00209273E2|nr:AAA family ATPase [Actinoallomurus purpureus]MCO6008156.1 AAA family ATPase [Actinoallomurus purpureus]